MRSRKGKRRFGTRREAARVDTKGYRRAIEDDPKRLRGDIKTKLDAFVRSDAIAIFTTLKGTGSYCKERNVLDKIWASSVIIGRKESMNCRISISLKFQGNRVGKYSYLK